MASANVELVRSIYADWERGDYSRVNWADPEIEFVLADGIDPGRWTGRAGMWEGWRGRLSAWEQHRTEADEYRVVDDERVLVLAHTVARGKTSGVDLGQMLTKGANVFHVRDGKIAKLVVYLDRARALADLGLEA
jgi:ketosteroid isomerase-like protein